jgi:hypothetical protein
MYNNGYDMYSNSDDMYNYSDPYTTYDYDCEMTITPGVCDYMYSDEYNMSMGDDHGADDYTDYWSGDDYDYTDYSDYDYSDWNDGDDYDYSDYFDGDDHDYSDWFDEDDHDYSDWFDGDDYDYSDYFDGDDYDYSDYYDYDYSDYYGDDAHVTGIDVASLAGRGLVSQEDALWYDSAVENLDEALNQYSDAIEDFNDATEVINDGLNESEEWDSDYNNEFNGDDSPYDYSDWTAPAGYDDMDFSDYYAWDYDFTGAADMDDYYNDDESEWGTSGTGC